MITWPWFAIATTAVAPPSCCATKRVGARVVVACGHNWPCKRTMAVITNKLKSKRRYFRVLQSQVQAGRERRRGRGRAILLTRRAVAVNFLWLRDIARPCLEASSVPAPLRRPLRGTVARIYAVAMVAFSSDYTIIYNKIIIYNYDYNCIALYRSRSAAPCQRAPPRSLRSRVAAVPPPCRRRAAAVPPPCTAAPPPRVADYAMLIAEEQRWCRMVGCGLCNNTADYVVWLWKNNVIAE